MDIIKKLGTAIALVSLGFLTASSLAQDSTTIITPESGWWVNPDESGRGYAIEVQDHQVFMAVYAYDNVETDGVRRPIWLFSGGVLIDDDVYEGTLNFLEDGQCLGCEYTAPAFNTSENKSVRIEFTSRTTAEITIDGEAIDIERLNFADSYKDPTTKILGAWHVVMNTGSTFSEFADFPVTGDVLVLEDTMEFEGDTYAVGCSPSSIFRTFCSDSDKFASVLYYEDSDIYSVIVDENPAERRVFWWVLAGERAYGTVDQPLIGTDFNTDRSQSFRAYRDSSREFVQTGSGPAKPTLNATDLFNSGDNVSATERKKKSQNMPEAEKQLIIKAGLEKQERFMDYMTSK